MMKTLGSIVLIALLTGCAASFLGDHKSSDRVVLTSAEQRAITVVSVDTDLDGRRIIPRRVVCAEPSPDIAKAVSDALQSSMAAKGAYSGVSAELQGSFSRSFTESIAQLGSRLATIQLLRDELSDLCRAYANGAVSSITYTLRLSRLDKKMITLLVSEASAGALSRALVSQNGSASVGAGPASPAQLKTAEVRISEAAHATTEAGKTLSDATAKLNQAKDDEAKAAAQKEVSKAEETLRIRLSELSDRVLEKWTLETRGSGLLVASTASSVASLPSYSVSAMDLRSIHRAYLDADDLGTLLDACLTSMEDNAKPGKLFKTEDNAIKELQANILKKETELGEAQLDLNRLSRRPAQTQAAPTSNPVDNKKYEDALSRMDKLNLELSVLNKELEEKTGSRDRTGLLTFCRRVGMGDILSLIRRKLDDRYFLETQRTYMEFCKAVVESKSIQRETQEQCVRAIVRPDQRPYVGPSDGEPSSPVPNVESAPSPDVAPDATPNESSSDTPNNNSHEKAPEPKLEEPQK